MADTALASPAPECLLCGTPGDVREVIDWRSLGQAWKRSYGVKVADSSSNLHYASCPNCSLGYFLPTVAGDEGLYENLQQHDWYYLKEKREYQVAASHLPAKGKVLEVGSGVAAFSSLVGASRYTGLEFNDAAIEGASKRGIRLIKETVEDHAQAHPGTYAAVVSFQVLEHVSDPRRFISSCCEALQPGGTLILAVPNHDGICGLTPNHLLDLPPHHMTHWSEATLRHLEKLFPLEVVAIDKEPVAKENMQWARHIVRENQLRAAVGAPRRLFDAGLLSRALTVAAAVWSRVNPPKEVDMEGHAILVVLKKKSA